MLGVSQYFFRTHSMGYFPSSSENFLTAHIYFVLLILAENLNTIIKSFLDLKFTFINICNTAVENVYRKSLFDKLIHSNYFLV